VTRSIVVFFPSYAYAEHIIRSLESAAAALRVALQPRAIDLAAQAAWVDTSLAQADALFLVLGSSFAESIDLLGGRVACAMVVGPALPEVNAIQRSRLAGLESAGLSRTAAFRRVYQIPGMQKVNQALGRLVRAPGQQARVLLHCRRFADPSYSTLLSPEYQRGALIEHDEDLAKWLGSPTPRGPDSAVPAD
jgi:Rad3-related DNA helicase